MAQPLPPPVTTILPPPPWPADIFRGAIKGDYARRLGIPGRLTQAVMGFIPVIGTVCAFRDFFACRSKHDRVGMVLNGLALIPFLGGFPKTAEVIRAIRHIGHIAVTGQFVVGAHGHHDHDQHVAPPAAS